MDFLTRELFDTLIVVVMILGAAMAAVRLYADLSRPLPPDDPPPADEPARPTAAQQPRETPPHQEEE